MSSTKAKTTQPVGNKPGGKIIHDTRIDSAHSINAQELELAPAAVNDSDFDSSVADSERNSPVAAAEKLAKDDLSGEQLRRQADQLAEYLRNRQKELDHREAQLNAEIAQMESDFRNARLWLSEREAEQEQGRQALDHREKEFLERLDRLAAADAALKRHAESETDLSGLSEHLSIENMRLAEQVTGLKEELRQSEIKRQQTDNELPSQQRQELEMAENRLARAQAEIQTFYEQLTAERRALREEIHQERRQMVVQQRQAMAEMEKKRQILQRRGEHVDQCRAELTQLRAELQQMHRETLEIRLATEELWMDLSGAAPPAALTHSLGRIRNRLADQYRLANAELVEQKKELESVRDQLVEQYEKLVEQKRHFDNWMQSKQGESQQQASLLIEREQALLRQQTHFEEQTERWQVERMQYEQEIRRLRLTIPHAVKTNV